MKRKDYEKPTMTVVELQQTTQLLQTSGQVEATRSGYGAANQGFEEGDDVWE